MNEIWLRAVVQAERAPGRDPLALWAPVVLVVAIAAIPVVLVWLSR